MGAKIKLVGMDKLNAALKNNMKLEAAKQIVKQNGSELQRKAMRNAPVKTGQLRRSIHLGVEDGGLTATVEATAKYAPYVEYGTRYMAGRHYMRHAYDAQIRIFKSDMDKLTK